MTDISYGVTYPAGQQEHSRLSDYVSHVEELGYDSIWLIENVSSGSPGLECLSTLGYMAACSTRLKIGTSILLLPIRNPVIVAQAYSSLDVLSEGRVILGVGVGDSGGHTAVGSEKRTRGARMEEHMEIIRKLWSEESTSYAGRFTTITDYRQTPRPVQTPHPPIWVGGHSPAALGRAARHADGFIPVGATPSQCGEMFTDLDKQTSALGRPPLTRAAHVYLCIDNNQEAARPIVEGVMADRYQRSGGRMGDASAHLVGSLDDCKRSLKAFLDVGVTHLIVDPFCNQDEAIDQVELCAKEILGRA